MSMQPSRGTLIERLADLIEILRIGNRTGTLTVERGEGTTHEEGSIIFVGGQAVEASVDQQSGSNAFNYLSTWGKCRFSFISGTGVSGSPPGPVKFTPGILNRSSTNNPGTDSTRYATNQQNGFYQRSSAGPGLPLRLQRGEEALQHPERVQLPRVHRRLLLLINGQRGVSELARLMARDSDETSKLLRDLEQSGLIRQ